MNKQDLIDSVSERASLPKSTAAKALEALMDAVTETLKAGNEITLHGLGKFSCAERVERTGRNPQTGLAIQIPKSTIPKFTPSLTLKRICNKA